MTTNWLSKEEALRREPKAGHLHCPAFVHVAMYETQKMTERSRAVK